MLVSIRHATHYSYDAVGSFAVQRLRLTPFDNTAQRVLSWVIEADGHRATPRNTSTASAIACT